MYQDNAIYVCAHCGEKAKGKSRYCAQCTTKAGRMEIYKANLEIYKERKAAGLPVPQSLPNPA
jgi:hypothetical protein